jgi:hypothetical protein
MRATMLLSATSNGVGMNVRLIWEWMDRLCKGLSIPRNQGIYNMVARMTPGWTDTCS